VVDSLRPSLRGKWSRLKDDLRETQRGLSVERHTLRDGRRRMEMIRTWVQMVFSSALRWYGFNWHLVAWLGNRTTDTALRKCTIEYDSKGRVAGKGEFTDLLQLGMVDKSENIEWEILLRFSSLFIQYCTNYWVSNPAWIPVVILDQALAKERWDTSIWVNECFHSRSCLVL
jgi:hypothetical protein